MKLSINRNIVWCDLFVSRLAELGVRNVCISPGSRSTPLTLAFASNKKIKSFPIVDERSSAFFSLGIAKKTDTPVAVVTTSGTAVAELYPAIIEAYYQRVPLIICTADRPPSLRNSGANQTINQQNIFKNHIRFFADAGLPDVKRLSEVVHLAENAIRYSCFIEKGPVHLNFSFEKPFEPKSYTDKIDVTAIQSRRSMTHSSFEFMPHAQTKINFEILAKKFSKTERGLIIVGSNRYQNEFENLLNQLSIALGYPIYIDGSSSLRFSRLLKKNTINNLTALIRAKNFQKHYDPEIIIQFGGTPTSNVLLEFFKNSKAEKILANEFGDRNDPSFTAKIVLRINPAEFCESVIQRIEKSRNRENNWLADLRSMNKIAEKEKQKLIEGAEFPFEGRVVTELLKVLPDKSNLMISNSLPIRDVDFFASSN
ncbi:MAG: 2-succinyl-5-enolpyruvyl-6-hydroxy-3-cyclohexene-1-carboxylic-acid synthase, partial [Bacteroidota bacterium]